VHFSLGALCVASGQLEEARRRLETVARHASNHVPTQAQLALVYTKLGDKDKAAAARAAAASLQKAAEDGSLVGQGDPVGDLIGKSASPRSD
jgi:Tfp pilus assembly protein PilF